MKGLSMRHLRTVIALLIALVLSGAGSTFAQEDRQGDPSATPGADAGASADRTDLAAITLSSDQMPEGYVLNGEVYTGGEEVKTALAGLDIDLSALDDVDFRWFYQSQYGTPDGQSRMRIYVEEFGSEDDAVAGFEFLEDETLFVQDGVNSIDHPGLGLGEEPSEVTVTTADDSASTPPGVTMDTTFRVGHLLVGVSIFVAAPDSPDEAILEELAAALEERAIAVVNGDDVEGIDSSLSGRILTFEGALPVQEGYVTLFDAIGADAPQAGLDEYESGYLRLVALNSNAGSSLPLPVAGVGLSTFSSEIGALAVIASASDLVAEFSLAEEVELDPIPGTSAAVAYSFANPFDGSSPDSFRLMVVIGTSLLTVDVEGASSLELAENTVLLLMDQSLDCFEDGGCGNAELPEEITTPKS
jgi:hypothetical protein